MGIYQTISSVTLNTIRQFGRPVKLRRIVRQPNPSNPLNPRENVTEIDIMAISSEDKITETSDISTTTARSTRFIFSAVGLTFVPETGDTILAEGKEYRINEINTTAPNGMAILYSVIGVFA